MTTRRMLLAAGTAFAAAPAFAQTHGAFDGEWNGVLRAGTVSLRLKLVVQGARAALYSLDQGAAEIPGTAETAAARIALAFPSINARFVGHLTDAGIEGTFNQGADVPLTFVRGQAVAPPLRALTAEGLEALRARAGSPAMAAISAARGGRGVSLAVGLRAAGRSEAVTAEDRWHLGSITKSMTATLVALAVEAGVVRWDEQVEEVFPEAAHSAFAKASFLHLMSHRAGLQANLPGMRMLAYRRENPEPMAERRAYALEALAQEPAGPPETTYLYSNSGFIIAGAMLEAKLGAAWEDLIRTRLFQPLGMTSAGFGAPGTQGAWDQPVGHAAGPAGIVLAFPPGGISDNPVALGPAGRVHCSLGDLIKFAAAHRDQAAMLARQSWARLHTPPFGGEYALGLIRRGTSLWHNGTNTLWYAEMIIDQERGIVAAAAANDGRREAVAAPVGEALIGAVAAAV